MNLFKCILLIIPVIILAGCASPPQQSEAVEGVICQPASVKDDAGMLTEVHYRAMQACLKDKNDTRAIDHFAIAGTETWYEAIVHPGEQTDYRHRALLSQALSGLSEAQKNQFWEMLNVRLRDLNEHKRVCSWLAAVGAERKKTQIFDELAWFQSTEGYMHCNGSMKF